MARSVLKLPCIFLCLVINLTNSFCFAEQYEAPLRDSYSYFGLGLDFLYYEENTAKKLAGETVDIETVTNINITQQSGAYASVNRDWGFYLVTASTLGESSVDETWLVNDTAIRRNKVAFQRLRLGFLGTRLLRGSHYLVLGGHYTNTEYKRFAGEFTSAAANLGIDENDFTQGAIIEKVWDVSGVIGYEYSTFFTKRTPGWNFQVQALLGVPLITSVSNTDVNKGGSIVENYSGIQLRMNAGVGYQFHPKAIAALALEFGYLRRDASDNKYLDAAGNTTELPETVVMYVYPRFVMSWSF